MNFNVKNYSKIQKLSKVADESQFEKITKKAKLDKFSFAKNIIPATLFAFTMGINM